MLKFLVLAAVLALASGPVAAAPDKPKEGPDWAEKPNVQDMIRTYPRKALNADVAGSAVVVCRVKRDGRLRACQVGGESPKGYGFDKAILKAAKRFRLTLPEPIENADTAVISIPIFWGLEGTMAPIEDFAPGDAILVTQPQAVPQLSFATRSCPTTDAPQRVCPAIGWLRRPSPQDLEPVIRGAGGGTSTMDCVVAQDGKLDQCAVVGSLSPEAKTQLLAQVTGYQAPPRARDGTPTAGKTVRLYYDWDALARYLDVYKAVQTGR